MTIYNEEDAAEIEALLMGRQVTKVNEDTLLLDDGTLLRLAGNEGCGGCGEGWYDLTALNGCDNVITKVELAGKGYAEVYEIFVYADNQKINLARFEGHDNGYYGYGYYIQVTKGL
jgi:hypothetical protein